MVWQQYIEPVLPFMPLLAACSLLVALVALIMLALAHRRISRLMLGKNGASLEESILTLSRRTKELEGFRDELQTYLKRAETRLSTSIRGVGTVRFNPFKGDGSGGNQSFSTALVSESGDGVVVSTLYSRDRVSVFGKPLMAGKSTFELTAEEMEAVGLAKDATQR